MVKNLADLIEISRRLRSPSNYYDGVRHGRFELPDNVLMFGRTGPRTLLESHVRGSQHFHHRHVLIIPLQGRGHMVLDGLTYGLEPGQCALVAPYQFHYFIRFGASGTQASDPSAEVDWLFITFERKGVQILGSTFRITLESTWQDLSLFMQDYLAGGSQSNGHSAGEYGIRLALRLGLILHALERESASAHIDGAETDRGEHLLLRVHTLIAGSPTRMLSIEEMAKQIGLSASHLRAQFRTLAGRSLGEFQREVRLQKAAELLTQTNATVGETAEACGWECAFAFSRAFSRYWGKPPKRFASSRVS
ncbi:MAG: AraC family transcriptional regulator [Candidatus Methylacidiphilales bacterium]|nr:AraC family transcriptional regulator [Candidatus Methylacidiphilales bacterium]